MKKRLLLVAAVVQLACVANGAHAQYPDQDEPQHQGITNWNTNSEVSFELVGGDQGIVIHLEDHERPLPTAGTQATVEIKRGGKAHKAALLPDGDNRLRAKDLSLLPGDQVVATVKLANGSLAMGRFVVR